MNELFLDSFADELSKVGIDWDRLERTRAYSRFATSPKAQGIMMAIMGALEGAGKGALVGGPAGAAIGAPVGAGIRGAQGAIGARIGRGIFARGMKGRIAKGKKLWRFERSDLAKMTGMSKKEIERALSRSKRKGVKTYPFSRAMTWGPGVFGRFFASRGMLGRQRMGGKKLTSKERGIIAHLKAKGDIPTALKKLREGAPKAAVIAALPALAGPKIHGAIFGKSKRKKKRGA